MRISNNSLNPNLPFTQLPILQNNTHLQQLHPNVVVSTRKLEHINCIISKSGTEGGLYIGDTISIVKSDYIRDNQIEAILCCNTEAMGFLSKYSTMGIETKYLPIEDHIHFQIIDFFGEANKFIESNRAFGKNVLIQCHAGVSRSGTILCAYLMLKKQKTFSEIYEMVTQIRPRIKPNLGFREQLKSYEKQLFSHQPKLMELEANKQNIVSQNSNNGLVFGKTVCSNEGAFRWEKEKMKVASHSNKYQYGSPQKLPKQKLQNGDGNQHMPFAPLPMNLQNMGHQMKTATMYVPQLRVSPSKKYSMIQNYDVAQTNPFMQTLPQFGSTMPKEIRFNMTFGNQTYK